MRKHKEKNFPLFENKFEKKKIKETFSQMNSPSKSEGNQLLFNVLNAALNPNQQLRNEAENKLKELSNNQGINKIIQQNNLG